MNGIMERTMGILEHLAAHTQGQALGRIAEELGIPRSATHRLLSDLCQCGYVRQVCDHGNYVLTTKLVSLGLNFLSRSGTIDLAQPLLDRLALSSGETVRLGLIDGCTLTWVAKAQGTRQVGTPDPDMGGVAQLSCTASGQAWMMTLQQDQVLELVRKQGLGSREEFGPNAPDSPEALLHDLALARQRGYSLTVETVAPGMAAMAAPVRRAGRTAVGVISIAGPVSRLNALRMMELGPELLASTEELAQAIRT
jgi:IclR family acetate operon transcriptional repressor